MIGAALQLKTPAYNEHGESLEPFIVAQTKKGNWVWVDENMGQYGVLTSAQMEEEYNIADVLPEDLVQESFDALQIMLTQDNVIWENYITNN